MKSLMKSNRGVLGMDTAKAFILLIFTVLILSFAVIVAVGNLVDNTGLTAGTTAANASNSILNNATQGIEAFWGNATTWFTMLAIAILILIIALVILAVNRFGGGSQSL